MLQPQLAANEYHETRGVSDHSPCGPAPGQGGICCENVERYEQKFDYFNTATYPSCAQVRELVVRSVRGHHNNPAPAKPLVLRCFCVRICNIFFSKKFSLASTDGLAAGRTTWRSSSRRACSQGECRPLIGQ